MFPKEEFSFLLVHVGLHVYSLYKVCRIVPVSGKKKRSLRPVTGMAIRQSYAHPLTVNNQNVLSDFLRAAFLASGLAKSAEVHYGQSPFPESLPLPLVTAMNLVATD